MVGEADVLGGRLGSDRPGRSGWLGGLRCLGKAGGLAQQRHHGIREPVQHRHQRDGLLVVAGGTVHVVQEPGRPLADAVLASDEVTADGVHQRPVGAA